jgi:hypothetical protein
LRTLFLAAALVQVKVLDRAFISARQLASQSKSDMLHHPERVSVACDQYCDTTGVLPPSQSASKTRVNALRLGKSWGGAWCDKAPLSPIRGNPTPTPPQRKSGLPDLPTMIRNPGWPGLRGEGNNPELGARLSNPIETCTSLIEPAARLPGGVPCA